MATVSANSLFFGPPLNVTDPEGQYYGHSFAEYARGEFETFLKETFLTLKTLN